MRQVVGTLLAILVAGGVSVGYFVGDSARETVTSTSTTTSESITTSTFVSTATVTDTSTTATTLLATSPPASIPSGSCITPVPAGANATLMSTSAFTGTMVNYGNGSTVVIPEDSCPQPVSNQTYDYEGITTPSWSKVLTNNYQLAVAAVTNQTFIDDENGTAYFYSQPGSSPYSTGSSDAVEWSGFYYYFTLIFYHYSNASQNWCGSANDRTKLVVSGIEVTFTAYFGSTWDLKDPSIQMMSPSDLGLDNACVIAGG
jgi:hypothetical protein